MFEKEQKKKKDQWIKRQQSRCAVQTQDDRAIIPINIPLAAKNVKI